MEIRVLLHEISFRGEMNFFLCFHFNIVASLLFGFLENHGCVVCLSTNFVPFFCQEKYKDSCESFSSP